MFDAREVLIPGSAYDRNAPQQANGIKFDPNSYMRHDQLGFIGHERGGFHSNNIAGFPVPVGVFMPPMQAYPPHMQSEFIYSLFIVN